MAQHTISTEDVRRIGRVVADFEGRPVNSLPRLERVVRVEGGVGGECECEEVHRFWTNGPDGGEFHATYEINSVSEEITWDWDATAYDIKTAFEAHSEIDPGDVEVNGGPWPFVAVYVKFKGALAATSIDFPALDNADLTNGSGFMDKFTAVEI